MKRQVSAEGFNFTKKKLLLIAVVISAIVVTIAPAQLPVSDTADSSRSATTSNSSPVFDIASIKPEKATGGMVMLMMRFLPNGFTARGATAQALIQLAYGVQQSQIVGAPNWVHFDRYSVDAKVADVESSDMQVLSEEDRIRREKKMLQSLLADRFKLLIRHETRELPIYTLVIAKHGPRLRESKPDGPHTARFLIDQIILQGQHVDSLVSVLSERPELADRMIIDQTGLTGEYDFNLKWTSDSRRPNEIQNNPSTFSTDSSGTSIFTALQDQLGLKLESRKGPVDVLVLDHVEQPSAN